MSEKAKNANDTDRWGTELEVFAAATALNTTIWLYANSGERRNNGSTMWKWHKYKPIPGIKSQFKTTKKNIFISGEGAHFVPVFSV